MKRKKKKKKIVIILIIFAVIFIALFASFVYFLANKDLKINYRFVNDDAVKGVDISAYQAKVDMDKLKSQGVSFVYIKATEGSTHKDRFFDKNRENAKKSGLYTGAYHFFSFDSSGITQAKNFIDTVGDLDNELLPVIDMEYYGNKKENPPKKENVIKELNDFLEIIQERYKVKPMIYTTITFYREYLKDVKLDNKMWVRSVYYPPFFDGWMPGEWTIWQYDDIAMLDGYEGGEKYIDLDVLNKNENIENLLVKN